MKPFPGHASGFTNTQNTDEDFPFDSVVKMMMADHSRMWNSVELFTPYKELKGEKLTQRRALISQLQQTFGDDLLVLSSPGIANIVTFRSCASKTLRLVKDDEDEMEAIITKASEHIIQDLKNINLNKEHYDTSINKEIIKESVSEFLLMLLAKVSPRLDSTLPALLIDCH